MTLYELCEKIELQPEVRQKVLSFADSFDFSAIRPLYKDFYTFETRVEAKNKIEAMLTDDGDHIKMLACMLSAAAESYSEYYLPHGISEEIYIDTMRAFPRYLEESRRVNERYVFEHAWWTVRTVGGAIFRIGSLEYEMKRPKGVPCIDIHIPTATDLSPAACDDSISAAKKFFGRHFPEFSACDYYCRSWLMANELPCLLSPGSNILAFRSRFEIVSSGVPNLFFTEMIFGTRSRDFASFPEDTSLQRALKRHILSGGVLGAPTGRLK